jgi:hypothetical protein
VAKEARVKDGNSANAGRREFIVQGTVLALGCFCSRAAAGEEKTPGGEFETIAYCGLDCAKCPAYEATKKNDAALKAKVAEAWKMKPEQIDCLGCKSHKALFNCTLKQCAKKRDLLTCAHCADFAGCKDEQWSTWPSLRQAAEALRVKLEAATKP